MKRLAVLVMACGLGAVPGAAQQQANMNLLLAAKTICSSDNSKVTWSKAGTEPDTHDIFLKVDKAASLAMKPFKVLPCEAGPDLVLRIDYHYSTDFLIFQVTDAAGGNAVWTDSRSVSDLSSDLYQMAHKFQQAVLEARPSKPLPNNCIGGNNVAVLRNGYSIRHVRSVVVGKDTRLFMCNGDQHAFVDVPTQEIDHIEPLGETSR
jgi:hypothetical protein